MKFKLLPFLNRFYRFHWRFLLRLALIFIIYIHITSAWSQETSPPNTALLLFQQRDPAQALEILKRQATRGDVYAQYNLGATYEWGLWRTILPVGQRPAKEGLWRTKPAETRDYKVAAKWYLLAANQGLPKAMVKIGRFYENGKGISANYTEALKWYRRAAEAGNVWAMYRLGYAHAYPSTGKDDDAKALQWFSRASDLGYLPAMRALAFLLDHGKGSAPDHTKATHLYRQAADKGSPEARFTLGTRYEIGLGTPINLIEAIHWYRMAALQGHSGAQKRLVYLLSRGQIKFDESLLAWAQAQARHGDPASCYVLGLSYLYGWGIPADQERAADWLLVALQAGYPAAQIQLATTVLQQPNTETLPKITPPKITPR